MGHDTSLGTERLAHQGSPRNDQRWWWGGQGHIMTEGCSWCGRKVSPARSSEMQPAEEGYQVEVGVAEKTSHQPGEGGSEGRSGRRLEALGQMCLDL